LIPHTCTPLPSWLRQHQALERLNLQAHQSAQLPGQEEWVVEAFVSLDKVPTLIHALVVMDCWRALLWPRLRDGVVAAGAGVRAYFVLYHEATLVNLLEASSSSPHRTLLSNPPLTDPPQHTTVHNSTTNQLTN